MKCRRLKLQPEKKFIHCNRLEYMLGWGGDQDSSNWFQIFDLEKKYLQLKQESGNGKNCFKTTTAQERCSPTYSQRATSQLGTVLNFFTPYNPLRLFCHSHYLIIVIRYFSRGPKKWSTYFGMKKKNPSCHPPIYYKAIFFRGVVIFRD